MPDADLRFLMLPGVRAIARQHRLGDEWVARWWHGDIGGHDLPEVVELEHRIDGERRRTA